MPFKFNGNNRFFKDFNSLPDDIRKVALSHGIAITKDPHIGEKATGRWRDFWKFDFVSKASYRIIYTVYYCRQNNTDGGFYCLNSIKHYNEELSTCNGLIDYVFVKTRQAMDNIYRLHKNQIDTYRRYLD